MSFFFTVFTIYGAMHVYAFLRARNAISFGLGAGIAIAAFMIVMVAAPFLVSTLERHEYELPARLLSFIAYLWMALVFLFFCSSVLLDAVNLILRGAGWVSGSGSFEFPSRTSFLAASGLAVAISVYGYFSALDIRTERLKIETAKLPPDIEKVKIVQISDVHLGLIVRNARLKKILEIVRAEKPDIFLSTGDLVDAQIDQMAEMADLLREVNARYGKYAVTGNHEYYAGIKQASIFVREAGFTLLRGESVKSVINIAGVDDPTGVQQHIEKPESETAILTALPKNRFTLLLKHRPAVDQEAAKLFDLQLSGHTHRGQIFPFTFITRMVYPLDAGRFDLPPGSTLYVSRGTGTWGPPVRFLSPPEVTVIELVRKSSS